LENVASAAQGYLAHGQKRTFTTLQCTFRTLQEHHAWGPMVVLGGLLFVMSEVPL